MRRAALFATAIALVMAFPAGLWAEEPSQVAASAELRTPAAFDAIQDQKKRSAALFDEMAKVITHPRCMNCHPVNNRPTQRDEMRPHQPPMVREDGMGPPGSHCNACHTSKNFIYVSAPGSVPGHAPWQLAPVSMGWVGLTVGEICAQLKDPKRNGERSLADLHKHNAEDGLVGWAWDPGEGRTPAPGTQEIFGALTKAWIDTGAVCPG